MGDVWRDLPKPQGLYDPRNEHDACGIGFVANIKGKRSYGIVDDALKILENLKHRGGEGADQKSGDGAGILTQIPHEFFQRECEVLGFRLPPEGQYGVGMIFAHRYHDFREEQKRIFEDIVKDEGQTVLGWREVPIDESLIGEEAKRIRPHFLQVFIGRNPDLAEPMDFERKLYIIRRRAEKKIIPLSEGMGTDFYIVSLSSKTIVYKGMLTSDQMRHFYLDLSDLDFKTAMAMVHSRFSTNTFPSWARAHPNRYIVHNGEINTIRGNINWLNARESKSRPSDYPELTRAFPVVDDTGSDSAMFDNCLEYLHMAGHSLAHAMMVMIPEPWEKDSSMSREKKDFYRYHNFMMEPWDGPAAICFCDGVSIGGMLDRNGLRPARYYVMKDDRVILSSEVGAVPVDQKEVLYKGRLEPGKIFLIDTSQQRIVSDEEIKHTMARAHPYGTWCREHILDLKDLPKKERKAPAHLEEEQRAFGYTQEDMRDMIIPMAQTGKDPVGAMGMDSPLAVLSEKPRLLYDYFQQNFAQVTNPPIDAIRESIVTSSTVYVGNMANIMDPDEKGTAALAMDRPLLTNEEMEAVKELQDDRLHPVVLSLLYTDGKGEMKKALHALFDKALKAVKSGHNILILSDRGVDKDHLALPALLASAGLHNFLIREKVRPDVGIILESGEPREVHHFCTLIGYGATAINPYLALDTAADLAEKGKLGPVTVEEALRNYMDASVKGILAVMSKMGISTVKSYHGAQIFEALGIGKEVADTCFGETTSPVGGLGFMDIEEENRKRHEEAYERKRGLPAGDVFKYRRNGDEPHILSAETIRLLQQACRTGSYEIYKLYAKKVNEPLIRLRDLLDFTYPAGCSIPIEEVESADSLISHFRTGAMSYGALSKEAHECIAKAMNHLHSRSNTGEGGEDPERFAPLPDGSSLNDEIKQVSTARFGVTGNYLVHGSEIQIKCAQGAKPGEGGHLPGSKVDPAIARTRRSTPGVSLISPPPHHDVYSIEDLAELIFDLKNANPKAEINVKLTAGSGVGTIAAGVDNVGGAIGLHNAPSAGAIIVNKEGKRFASEIGDDEALVLGIQAQTGGVGYVIMDQAAMDARYDVSSLYIPGTYENLFTKADTLEELAEKTGISKSALASYENEENRNKEINHGNLITLADFYEVSIDYLFCRTENREQINTPLSELHLTDEAVALLKSGRINTRLLCEMMSHEKFAELMADAEIYVDGMATMRFHDINSALAAVRAMILEEHPEAAADRSLKILEAGQIEEEDFFCHVTHKTWDAILHDIRKAHENDMESAPDTTPADELIREVQKAMQSPGDRVQQFTEIFCKAFRLKYKRLSQEERSLLKKLFKKSPLIKQSGMNFRRRPWK